MIGTGSTAKGSNFKNHLIYAMCVDKKLTFDEYWNDARFFSKRPIMNGSNMQLYGDNIYHINSNAGEIIQENSHHSLEGGVVNKKNYEKDLSGQFVLISKKYWYYGEDAILIPDKLKAIIKSGRGYYKINDIELLSAFVIWIHEQKEFAFIGKPAQFSGKFERFKGD